MLIGRGSERSNVTRLLNADDIAVQAFRAIYGGLFASLRYDIGLWQYICGRTGNILALPYDEWICPDLLTDIHESHCNGQEDRLFAGIHRIAECWLRLVEDLLDQAISIADGPGYQVIAKTLDDASTILRFLAQHIEVLDAMILEDYHPLRVALKGSSGAQSAAALRIIQKADVVARSLLGMLAGAGCDLIDALRAPQQWPTQYEMVEALSNLEAALSAFFFHHYQRALRVQSRQGLGALGDGIEILTRRFMKAGSAEIDAARFTHVLATNLEYAWNQGTLVYHAEKAVGAREEQTTGVPISGTRAQSTLAKLGQAIGTQDLDAACNCFSDHCEIVDPEGSRPYSGKRETRAWLEGLFQGVTRGFLSGSVKEEAVSGTVQVTWSAFARTISGHRLRFKGAAAVGFTIDGRICSLITQWDPSVLSPTRQAARADG
jgi:tryptophan 2,3-dioxygenase